MSSKVLEHIQSRPIAPVINVSSEKGNSSALKLICVIDHELETAKLYTEITTIPKLTGQLLKFHSLGSFKYVSYKLPKYLFGNKLLRCKVCQLVGPYVTVLEHMVISHNLHANTEICMWCERMKIKVHVSQNTLNQCYGKYVENQQLNNGKYPKVMKTFYKLLKKLAEELHVKISRSESFKSTLKNNNDTGNEMVMLISKQQDQREINLEALETLYQKAMVHFYQEELHEYLVFDTNMNKKDKSEHGNQDTAGEGQSSASSNLMIEVDPAQVDMSQSPSRFETPHSTVHIDMPQPSPQLESSRSSIHPEKQSLEMTTDQSLINFITSALGYIKDEQLREQAKSEIQSIVCNYLAQDMIKQIKEDLKNH